MIDVRVRGSFLLLAAAIVLFCGLDTAFAAFAAVLVHEGAHVLAARCFGGRLDSVTFELSGIALNARFPGLTSYVCDAVCAAAGPALNLVLGTALAFAAKGNKFLYTAAGANILLGIYNMIPADGLDGGTVAGAFFKKILPFGAAEKASAVLSLICALGVSGAGLWLWVKSGNISLFVCGIVLGWTVWKKRGNF